MTRRKTDLRADVAIIGGGLAGGAMALALAKHGVSVVSIDREDPKTMMEAAFDGRCSAIALSAKNLLSRIGVWDEIAPEACPIEEIRVADGDSPLFLHYDHADVGGEPFGFMVENRVNRRGLNKAMKGVDGLVGRAPAEVESIDRRVGGATVRLGDRTVVRAGLLVGADGRRSKTRDDAGIKLTSWSYRQVGIVCTVKTEKPHNNIAHEHFLPAGPFAILPMLDNRASLVWTEKESLGKTILGLSDEDFHRELMHRFGDFLGEVKIVGPRWAYPLNLQYAERATDRRLVLIGDAYHGMHPIAGQGLNMGLRDVAALAEILVETKRLGLDLGDSPVLARYERWRRFDNTVMLALTDALTRLFSNDIGPVRVARDIGLATVNKIPPLKRLFMRHAMGLVGELPRLLKGEPL